MLASAGAVIVLLSAGAFGPSPAPNGAVRATDMRRQNDPIPGVDIIVKKKPAGKAEGPQSTDRDGRFSVRLVGGDYELTLSPEQVDRAVAKIAQAASAPGKVVSPAAYVVSLSYDITPAGATTARRQYQPVIIRKGWTGTTLSIPREGATVTGRLVADNGSPR